MAELAKDEQIEEMADLIWNDTNCSEQAAIRSAEVLYNFGYRKASDIALEVLKEVRELYMRDDQYAALERRIEKKYTEAKK